MLDVRNLVKTFTMRGSMFRRSTEVVQAVSDVSFAVARGETLSLVGESGCGKSTTARCVVRILEPDSGTVTFDGVELTALAPEALRKQRRRFQMVFQDPHASLEPADDGGRAAHANRSRSTASNAGDSGRGSPSSSSSSSSGPTRPTRYPHQFSGGQRQRIGIARALAVDPDLLVLDEPVSALDVSIQAEIIRLLRAAARASSTSRFLFIAHDLSVVRHLSDRVAVMYLGRIVEIGTAAEVYESRPIRTPRPCCRRRRSPIR